MVKSKVRRRTEPEQEENVETTSCWSHCGVITQWIVLVSLCIATMSVCVFITCFLVYANVGWRGQGSDDTWYTAVIGLTQAAVGEFVAANGTVIDGLAAVFKLANATSPCPLVGPCPPLEEGCIERNDTCTPQPDPPCVPAPPFLKEPCLEPLPCRNGTCLPPVCPKPLAEPSLESFKTSMHRLDSKPLYEWINMYPAYSANRLEAVTLLLDEFIEPWVLAGFFHKCTPYEPTGTLEQLNEDTRTCTFCEDRYDYIACVMSGNLVGQVYKDSPAPPYINQATFRDVRQRLAHFMYEVNVHTQEATRLDDIVAHIQRTIKGFAVETENGDECHICEDLFTGREIYFNKCINIPGKRYVRPDSYNHTREL